MDGWPQGPRHLSGVLRNTRGGTKGQAGKGKNGPGRGHRVDTQRWHQVFREDDNAHTAISANLPGLRQVAGERMSTGALRFTTIDSSQGGEADI
eukprot:7867072-Pyramimonas_sp.AAC.1